MQFCHKAEREKDQAGKKMAGPDSKGQDCQNQKRFSQMADGQGEGQNQKLSAGSVQFCQKRKNIHDDKAVDDKQK